MNREEFQKSVVSRFSNTDSGFGNMTQRELILLQIASNIYQQETLKKIELSFPEKRKLLVSFHEFLQANTRRLFNDEKIKIIEKFENSYK